MANVHRTDLEAEITPVNKLSLWALYPYSVLLSQVFRNEYQIYPCTERGKVVHTPQVIFVEKPILILGKLKLTLFYPNWPWWQKFVSLKDGSMEKYNIYPTVLVTSVLVASLLSYQDQLELHQSTIYSKICSFFPSQPRTTKTRKGTHTHVCLTQIESPPSR